MKETKKHTQLKKVLFGVVIGLLFLPLLQQYLGIFREGSLGGSFEEAMAPEITLGKWMDGSFQTEFQDYTDEQIGFRNFMVRLYNQYHYSFFQEAKANGVVTGKEGYLFEESYIRSHLGLDPIPFGQEKERVSKLKSIRDTLLKRDVELMVAIAPGKASFHEEFIPDSYFEEAKLVGGKTGLNNYTLYRDELQQQGIPLLDLRRYFLELKSDSPYPLYPKNGTHWSKYGVYLAADTLVKYIGGLLDRPVYEIALNGVETSTEMRGSDDDVEKGMNLLFDLPDLEMAYPDYELRFDRISQPIRLLSTGDSYYWGLYPFLFEDKLFWYYSREVHPNPNEPAPPPLVSELDVRDGIEEHDLVMLIVTEGNMNDFGFGFIDRAYDAYFGENKVYKDWKMGQYARIILHDEAWSKTILGKARAEEIPFHEAVKNNAEYLIWQDEESRRQRIRNLP